MLAPTLELLVSRKEKHMQEEKRRRGRPAIERMKSIEKTALNEIMRTVTRIAEEVDEIKGHSIRRNKKWLISFIISNNTINS